MMTRTTLSVLSMCVLLGAAASAQETTKLPVSPESKLWVEGTSTLHDWTCRTQTLDATIEFEASAAEQLRTAPPTALRRVSVKVPVKSLKCGHGAMDNNLYKALSADAEPEISYILATFEPVPGESDASFGLKTVGTLKIVGTERRIAMDVTATRLPDGSVKAAGTVPIKMTDFGIKPPTVMFGRIKTGNDVKVKFELTVTAEAMGAAKE
jgi:polyisoprenoid-binding protein YceI